MLGSRYCCEHKQQELEMDDDNYTNNGDRNNELELDNDNYANNGDQKNVKATDDKGHVKSVESSRTESAIILYCKNHLFCAM